ncbi:phospholipase D-like domain-containing protein [Salinispirillum sp. LH 10-3-1]|uniref:Phospholipase D-like domain-containing protein n=1 Tax=Salinispirillum sp. LH 10-3-1 TaxID=2952525 RepID=A0AB38YEJ0_9GAMM
MTRRHIKYGLLSAFAALLVTVGGVGWHHANKALPAGLDFSGELRAAHHVKFLADVTYVDDSGERHTEQTIFDEIFGLIDAAEHFLLLDMFLFNSFQGAEPETHRALSSELTDRLLARREAQPDMQIVVITDPINTLYGSLESGIFNRLEAANIDVVITHLPALRDSNPAFSALWRTFIAPWGVGPGDTFGNPIGAGRISARSYLSLINFKANHRKLMIADNGDLYVAVVTSANPHDASSAHGNVALRFTGPAVADLLATERAVLAFSGGPDLNVAIPTDAEPSDERLQVLTEQAIKQAWLATVARTRRDDLVDVAAFYLADRDIVAALIAAQERGVTLRVLLDPAKDSFGREKNGIPNRQTALALHAAGVPVRWCATHGEQCHSKFLQVRYANGDSVLLLGSANLTRRNLDNYNLETNVLLEGTTGSRAMRDSVRWFDRYWHQLPGQHLSTEYATYADEDRWRQALYWLMERWGLSTF